MVIYVFVLSLLLYYSQGLGIVHLCTPHSACHGVRVHSFSQQIFTNHLLWVLAEYSGSRHPGPIGTLLPPPVPLSWDLSPRHSFPTSPWGAAGRGFSQKRGSNRPSSLPPGSYKRCSCWEHVLAPKWLCVAQPSAPQPQPIPGPLGGLYRGATKEV